MTGDDFAELVKAATLKAIQRTEARSPAAAAAARRDLPDVIQAAALDALERIAAGDAAPLAQLAHRAAAAAIMRHYRSTRHNAPEPAQIDEDAPPAQEPATSGRAPEEAAEAAELIDRIAAALPAGYRADAPGIMRAAAAGYNAAEIARSSGQDPRRIQRIMKAARAAAERMNNYAAG